MISPYLDFHRDTASGKITEYSLHGLSKKHIEALYLSLILSNICYTKFDGVFLRSRFTPHDKLKNPMIVANRDLLKILHANLKAQSVKKTDFAQN